MTGQRRVEALVPVDVESVEAKRWLLHEFQRRGWRVPPALVTELAVCEIALADVGNDASHRGDGRASSEPMMLTVTEASRVTGVSDRTVRERARSGRYVGARQLSSGWLIPLSVLEEEIVHVQP